MCYCAYRTAGTGRLLSGLAGAHISAGTRKASQGVAAATPRRLNTGARDGPNAASTCRSPATREHMLAATCPAKKRSAGGRTPRMRNALQYVAVLRARGHRQERILHAHAQRHRRLASLYAVAVRDHVHHVHHQGRLPLAHARGHRRRAQAWAQGQGRRQRLQREPRRPRPAVQQHVLLRQPPQLAAALHPDDAVPRPPSTSRSPMTSSCIRSPIRCRRPSTTLSL